ncbi:MAG: MFS transporter, partial [Proteobacteria bacterium]|nr:MFS transporter [Pseudomonadota bacterium]
MSPQRTFWTLVLASAAILAVTMGIRQSTGLFVSSINSSTGLGIVTVSLAMAVGQ